MAKLHLAQEILDIIYPIGSIYLSVNTTNPKNLFGGTWQQMKGGYLYGAETVGNSSYTGTEAQAASGNTGSTTLTVEQIPSHRHNIEQGYGQNVTTLGAINWSVTTDVYGQGRINTAYTGGGKGHTHTLNNHTHNVAYIGVLIWKRTA